MSNFASMGLHGLNIDIETGRPVESPEVKQARIKDNVERLTRAQGVAGELRGEPGKALLTVVLDAIEKRILEVLQNDPVCVHMMIMLKELNYQGNIARRQSVELIRRQLGEDTPDWILAAAR